MSRGVKQQIPVKLFGAAFVATLAILGSLGSLKSSGQRSGMGGGDDDQRTATAGRPNQKGPRYVGPKARGKCHETETSQRSTAMGRAMGARRVIVV